MKLFRTARGSYYIIENGYKYRYRRKTKSNSHWVCTNNDCPATAKTDIDFSEESILIIMTNHNHDPNIDLNEIESLKNEIKYRAAENPTLPTRHLIDVALSGQPRHIILNVGSRKATAKMVQRIRNSAFPPLPPNIENIDLPDFLTKTMTDDNFYRYGPGKYHVDNELKNVMIFYSDEFSEKLKDHDVWAVDGTFFVTPTPFYQLITISFIQNHHAFPSIFILIEDKSQEIYFKLYTLIKILIPELNPRIILCDFEIANINALVGTWPECQIQGCYFHFAQCIWRKINELNLKSLYINNKKINKFCRVLLTLAFMSQKDAEYTFFEILRTPERPQELNSLYSYFTNNFLGNILSVNPPPFPHNLWRIIMDEYNEIPKTNNAIEGWHQTFKRRFTSGKANIYLFVKNLIFEQEALRHKFIYLSNGEELERNYKYKLLNHNIFSFLDISPNKSGVVFAMELVNYLGFGINN